MDRFLQIQIWNASNTAIEYDNKVDDFWGIDAGTADLTQIMMANELSYGEVNASMFQVTVFGLDKNIKLNGRRIVVTLDYTYEEYSRLVDSDDNSIVDSDDNIFVPAPDTISTSENLFNGIINTSESDIIKTDRIIVAYDRLYDIRNNDISSWWNTWWKSKIGTSVTLATFRESLLQAVGIPTVSKTLINDDIVIPNPFTSTSDDNVSYTT